MNTIIEKLKAIIRLQIKREELNFAAMGGGGQTWNIETLEWVLKRLSDLEKEEKPIEELEEELDRFIESGKSVTVDDYGTYKVSYHDFKKVARHFAEWQKAKDDRYIDTIYQQGIEKGKDEMMEQFVSEGLEEEIDACWQNWLSPSNQKEVEEVLPKTEFAMYARHFAKWGAEHLKK